MRQNEQHVKASDTSACNSEPPSLSRSMYLWLLLVLCVGIPLVALLPTTRSLAVECWAQAERVGASVLTYVPEPLHPLVVKGASVFLSPWLYLLMAVVFLAEKVLPADRRQRVLSVGMVQDFLGWFVLGGVVRVVLVGVLVSALYAFCDRFLGGIRLHVFDAWPRWSVVLLAVLAGDFLNWFHHYLRHKVNLFWLFHTIHHSQRQMNMFTDLRVHVVEYAIAKPITILPLYVLGLDLPLAFWLTLVLEAYTRIYHANLRTNYGPLRYLLVTPQSHRIHHSILPQHMDKNFAVIFSFWDRLFGTQWPGYDEYPPTGVDDPLFPHERSVGGVKVVTNYLRQLAYPFIVIGRRIRSSQPSPTQERVSGGDV